MNKFTKSTQARLEMLERQNRWLTIIAGATVATLLVVATGGPAVIRAMSTQLVDEDEQVRAALLLKNDEGRLRIFDRDGKVTASESTR